MYFAGQGENGTVVLHEGVGQVIRHIVFFTTKPEHRDAVRAGLSILTAIPHARVLEIGENVKTDQLGSDIDIVVYGEFDDEAALAAYKQHPHYQTSIERVRPIREMRIAADYDASRAVRQPIDR